VYTGRIDVDLAEQTLAVYDNNNWYSPVIASWNLWTRPGLFQIYEKKETRQPIIPDFYYLDNVPWTMYFDKRAHYTVLLANTIWISTITWMYKSIGRRRALAVQLGA
jgi:hypothetical protein